MRTDGLGLVAQAGVDVPDATGGNYILAAIVVISAASLLLAYWYYRKDYGLPEAETEHRRHLIGAKAEQTPAVRVFDAAAVRNGTVDVAAAARELFERPADAVGGDRATLRQAAGDLRASLAAAWSDRTDGIPALVVLALRRALWVALSGAVALETAIIVRYVSAEPDYPTLPELYADTVYYLGRGVSEGRGLAGQFPYAGLLWDLTLAYGILLAQWLYQHWYVVAAALLVGAGVIALLTRAVEYRPAGADRGPVRYRLAFWVVTGLVTWLVGTAVAVTLRWAGVGVADPVGIGMAALVVAGAVVWRLKPRVSRARTTLQMAGWLEGLALVVARTVASLTRVLATVALVLTVVYLAVAVGTGDLGSLWSAWTAASTGVQLLTIVTLLVIVGAVAWVLRDAREAIVATLAEALSRKALRAALLGRGLPLLAVVAAYILAWALGQSIAIALTAALVASVLVRAGYVLVERARYQARLTPTGRQPRRVTVRCYALPDADGREHYYAVLGTGGHAVAAPDRDIAAAAVAEAVAELARGEDPTPTLASVHAEHLLRHGLVSRDRVRQKVRERVRSTAVQTLREEGWQTDRETFREALADLPPDVRDQRLAELESDVLRRGDDWVALDRDAYAELTEDRRSLPTGD